MEAALRCKEWRALVHVTMSFTWSYLLGPVFFRTELPCSGGHQLERGGMPLHDAVGINCERAQLLKIEAQKSSIRAKGCMWDMCLFVLFSRHDYPSLVEGESHGILLLLLLIKYIKYSLNPRIGKGG